MTTEPVTMTPLDLSDNRLAASAAHLRLRALILTGQLAPGTVISQVDLAIQFGISRTPIREALRMLQEEGLVESEPNRRCRVASFDALDMDATYGIRLTLEALGMHLTLPGLRPAALERAALLLDELDELGGPAAGDRWHRAHHEFHQTFVAAAPRLLLDQIVSHAQHSERYMYQEAHASPADSSGRPGEHRRILELVRGGDFQEAIVATSRHLARTPLVVLAEVASETEPAVIRRALKMIAMTTAFGTDT